MDEPAETLEAPVEAAEEPAAKPAKVERADKPAENARRKPEPANAHAAPRPQEPSRNGRHRGGNDHGNEPSPVGFGEEIPAFMLIRTGS